MKQIRMITVLALCITLLAGCGGIHKPVETTEDPLATYVPETTIEPTIIPSTVDPEDDLTPEELANSFVVENLSPYSGIHLDTEKVEYVRYENVYALKITNVSDRTVLNAQLNYHDGTNELRFYFEMLPAGQSVIVVESDKRAYESDALEFIGGSLNYLEDGMERMDSVEITPTDDSSLTVKNLTEETLPIVWIFYRDTNSDGTPLDGTCFSTMVVDLQPGDSQQAEAPEWMRTCVIVDVLVLDELPE